MCIFSQRQPIGMRLLAISQNGLSGGGSMTRIAFRIVRRLCQTAPQWPGDGRKVVSIACCDLMNRCRTNGNISAKIRCALGLLNIQTTGHISFNSTPDRLASDTDALQSRKTQAVAVVSSTTMKRAYSRYHRRRRFSRKRDSDFSWERWLLAKPGPDETSDAGSVREESRISLGMVSRAATTNSQRSAERRA